MTSRRQRRTRLPAFVAALALAGPVAAVAAADPPEEPPARTAESDHPLDRARDAGRSALDWLERRTEPARRALADRAAAAESSLRRSLADAADRAAESRTFGVRLLDRDAAGDRVQWRSPDAAEELPSRLVLLVHGIDEPGGIWNDLAPALAAAGHAVARFDYPNDGSLADAADLLGAALEDLLARGVRTVDIAAHSAGGLIVRDVLTRPRDGGPPLPPALPEVPRVITYGTPNQGSPLARLRPLAEAREHLVRWLDSGARDPATLLGFLHDGRGEVAADLLPGSAYLQDLNARPLPEGTRFTVVVATVAEDRARSLADTLSWDPLARALGEERRRDLERAILDLGGRLGDGVVPTSSQLLPGADDVVYVEANHRTMIRRLALPGVGESLRLDRAQPPAVAVTLERLADTLPPRAE